MCMPKIPDDLLPMPVPGNGPWSCVGTDCRIIIVSVEKVSLDDFSFSPECTPDQQKHLVRWAERQVRDRLSRVRGTCPENCVCIPLKDAQFRETDPYTIPLEPFRIIDPRDPHCFILVEKATVTITMSVIDGLCAPLVAEDLSGAVGPDGAVPLERPETFPPSVLKRILPAR